MALFWSMCAIRKLKILYAFGYILTGFYTNYVVSELFQVRKNAEENWGNFTSHDELILFTHLAIKNSRVK